MPTEDETIGFDLASNDDASRRSRRKAFCLLCQTIVGSITDEQAANFLQTDLYTLERLAVEGGFTAFKIARAKSCSAAKPCKSPEITASRGF